MRKIGQEPRPADSPPARRSNRWLVALDERAACRRMVGLLALAHAQGCEGALGEHLEQLLAAGELPDPDTLRQHFLPLRRSCRRSACTPARWPTTTCCTGWMPTSSPGSPRPAFPQAGVWHEPATRYAAVAGGSA